MNACDVATGGHNTTLAAANDHRLISQLWIVALFNGRVKSVAIDMREAEIKQFAMSQQPWTAT